MAPKNPSNPPIGEQLRLRRIEELHKGLRETAKLLAIAPAHLTDIEKGRRNPSEDLLLRIARVYGVAEAELRAGWNRPDTIVSEVATQDAVAAEKVPEFLRMARKLTSEQWNKLISQAKHMTDDKRKG